MSLLDDVSIVVTPNGYKAGTLYGVLPVPTEGSEEITNGGFDTDSDWTKGTGWTISGGKANASATTGQLYQSTNTTTNTLYKIEYTISNYVSGTYNFLLRGTSTPSFSGNGTFTIYLTSGSGSNSNFIIDGVSSFTGSIDNISVKEWTASDMDVTRATASTRVDEDGLVNYAQVVGSEIADITSGTPDSASNWANVTSNSVDFTGLGASGVSYYNDVATGLVSGETYSISLTITNFSGSSDLGVSGQGGVPTSLRFSNDGSHTATFTSDGSNIRIFGRAGTNTATFSNFSIKKVNRDNVPRIDYTGGGCPHILAEPQRTNLVTYSEDFTQWSKTGTTDVSPNDNISPDGTQNASTVSGLTGSGSNDLYLIVGGNPASKTYSFSVYLKGSGTLRLQISNNVDQGINEIVTLTSDWKRHIVTGTFNSTSGNLSATLDDNGATATQYNIWGAQLEEATYPTSYIPTSGSTVTRNQDQFTRDGIGSLINSTEGVLFFQGGILSDDGTTQIISLFESASSRVSLTFSTTLNRIQFYVAINGFTNTVTINAEGFTKTDINKIALRYGANNYALFINGVKEGENTTQGNTFTVGSLTELTLSNTLPFYGKVKQLQVYDTALTDNQLIQLTGEAGTHFFESYSEMAETLTYTIQ
jgi:hypothetical protein